MSEYTYHMYKCIIYSKIQIYDMCMSMFVYTIHI